jgi:hypothetical protein
VSPENLKHEGHYLDVHNCCDSSFGPSPHSHKTRGTKATNQPEFRQNDFIRFSLSPPPPPAPRCITVKLVSAKKVETAARGRSTGDGKRMEIKR